MHVLIWTKYIKTQHALMKAHRFNSNSRFLSDLDILIMLFGQFEGMKLNLEQNRFQYRQLQLKSGSTFR